MGAASGARGAADPDQHHNELEDALRGVEADERCADLARELPEYARDRALRHLPDIRANLALLKAEDHPTWDGAVDILWPGSGYNSVACGGNFAVLSLLEHPKRLNFSDDGPSLLKVGRIMGASGGAASALLSIADPNSSTETLLKYYMAYALWLRQTKDLQIWSETPVWAKIYERCIRDEAAFARMKERGWVAVAKGKRLKNAVLHDFKTREQCVQAYFASGNASVHGFFRGTSIDEVDGTVSDGGQMSFFPSGAGTALLYYNTSYDSSSAMNCTLDSIEALYKAGVDQTIQTLLSKELHVGKDVNRCGGMSLRLPGEAGAAGSVEFKHIKEAFSLQGGETEFHNLETGVKCRH